MLEEEEEEDPDKVYFSTDDLLQVRKSIFLLFKNILRLLQKFSLKEKPQCLQNCLQVIRFYSGNLYVLHHKRDAEPCKDTGVLAGLPFTDWSPEQTVLYKSQGRVHALCLCLMLSACWLVPAGPFPFHSVVLTLTAPRGKTHNIEHGDFGVCLRSASCEGLWCQSYRAHVLCSGTQADLHIVSLCESAKLSFLSLQIFVEMTNFEPVEHEFKFSATM